MLIKNWKAISTIADPDVRIAMALADLNSPNGKYLVSLCPEYFSSEPLEQELPIRLSELAIKVEEIQRHDGVSIQSPHHLIHHKMLPLAIPVFCFTKIKCDHCPEALEVSSVLEHCSRVGETVDWYGYDIVLVDTYDNHWHFAPAECILIDC